MNDVERKIMKMIEDRKPGPIYKAELSDIGYSYNRITKAIKDLFGLEEIFIQTIKPDVEGRSDQAIFIPEEGEQMRKLHTSHCKYPNSVVYRRICDLCKTNSSCAGYQLLIREE